MKKRCGDVSHGRTVPNHRMMREWSEFPAPRHAWARVNVKEETAYQRGLATRT
jgi:hypothetical protein